MAKSDLANANPRKQQGNNQASLVGLASKQGPKGLVMQPLSSTTRLAASTISNNNTSNDKSSDAGDNYDGPKLS